LRPFGLSPYPNGDGPAIGEYTSKGEGQDLKRSAMVGDDQWHFNTGHGYDRAHTGPDGTTNDLRTTNLKHPGVRTVGDQGRRLRCDGNRRQAHGPPGGRSSPIYEGG
jgi:hypothetical protein